MKVWMYIILVGVSYLILMYTSIATHFSNGRPLPRGKEEAYKKRQAEFGSSESGAMA